MSDVNLISRSIRLSSATWARVATLRKRAEEVAGRPVSLDDIVLELVDMGLRLMLTERPK